MHKQAKPLAKQRVSLASHVRTLYSRHTSNEGDVDFPRLAPGDYTITIVQENVETQLMVRSSQGETREG